MSSEIGGERRGKMGLFLPISSLFWGGRKGAKKGELRTKLGIKGGGGGWGGVGWRGRMENYITSLLPERERIWEMDGCIFLKKNCSY